jgi:hypothetical protein
VVVEVPFDQDSGNAVTVFRFLHGLPEKTGNRELSMPSLLPTGSKIAPGVNVTIL